MAPKTTPVRRSLALALVGCHLLLSGAAVPHGHDHAGAPGPEATDRPHHAHPPHRHWAWGGHRHAAYGHAHGSPRAAESPSGRADAPPRAPVEHDQDALYLADAYVVAELGSPGLTVLLATGWITAASPAGPDDATPRLRPWPLSRPPGDCLPAHHALLPHVLRL